ncbi:hypothetical protein BSLG_004912 [Batrachochytrium salamandrivorans]|nr:hypothetical protein BSLG_004912 [Batrachochytrium salamandrivorans]
MAPDGCPYVLLLGKEMLNITFMYIPFSTSTWVSSALLSLRRSVSPKIPRPNSNATIDFCLACTMNCTTCTMDPTKGMTLFVAELTLSMASTFHYVLDVGRASLPVAEIDKYGALGLPPGSCFRYKKSCPTLEAA